MRSRPRAGPPRLDRLTPLGALPARAASRFARSAGGRALAATLGREAAPERWAFVVGCYNSGTTLLADILREHPQVMGPTQEAVFLTDRLSHPEAFGWTRMWHVCIDRLRQSPEDFDAGDIARIRRQWGFWSGPARPVLVEKSIANAYRMPLLQTLFPPASFIHLIRDGAAVAEGIRRKARPGDFGNSAYPDRYPLALCAAQWRESVAQAARDRPRIERFLEIRYEDLAADPDATLRRVTDFLGLDPFAESKAGPRRVHGVQSEVRDMNASSRARLSDEDWRVIAREAGGAMATLGYPLPAPVARDRG